MTTILFFTDIHLRNNTPQSRNDDFPQSILNKIEYIINYANTIEKAILISGGDIFDTHIINPSLLIKLIQILNKSKHPIYTVIGNHDIQGYSKATINNASIGILLETNIINLLEELTIDNVYIKGLHAYSDNNFKGAKTGLINILVAHKPITNYIFPKTIKISELEESCDFDLILSGDVHMPHIIKRKHIYINPGALARITTADRYRTPMFVEIKIGQNITHKFIPVPHNKLVFDIKITTTKNVIEHFVNEYYNKIQDIKKNKISLEEQIDTYIKTLNIDKNIELIIKDYFKKAKEAEWK